MRKPEVWEKKVVVIERMSIEIKITTGIGVGHLNDMLEIGEMIECV